MSFPDTEKDVLGKLFRNQKGSKLSVVFWASAKRSFNHPCYPSVGGQKRAIGLTAIVFLTQPLLFFFLFFSTFFFLGTGVTRPFERKLV